VAALYYGINNKNFGRFNLRKVGWLKPFVIGFTWAGFVTIYPALLYNIERSAEYIPSIRTVLLFIKNFMFVSVLCILFDIKDYATDANHQLKTFVVKVGLRKTIFYIIIPLSAIGLGSFLVYAAIQQFSIPKMLLNTIPFILLITVAYSLSRRKSILYYLIIIDGLMLVKAICGSIAMICF
jgi:4-hydroxybenzoate polyprenyltransferase